MCASNPKIPGSVPASKSFHRKTTFSWPITQKSRRQQKVSLVVAGNGGNIFSNGLSGNLEISNSGMSPFPLRESAWVTRGSVQCVPLTVFWCDNLDYSTRVPRYRAADGQHPYFVRCVRLAVVQISVESGRVEGKAVVTPPQEVHHYHFVATDTSPRLFGADRFPRQLNIRRGGSHGADILWHSIWCYMEERQTTRTRYSFLLLFFPSLVRFWVSGNPSGVANSNRVVLRTASMPAQWELELT